MKKSCNKGFTLIELLVVISIIAFLSSVVFATLNTARVKARDSARIQVARQIALALEQYEQSNNTYKISNSGLTTNHGSGFIAKGAETPGYTNSILSTLKQAGYMSSGTLKDPVFGTDNFYLGLCTSTNAYNVFVKLEQPEYNQATSSIVNTCGGPEAAALGFSYIASVSGGSSSGSPTSGFAGMSDGGGGGFLASTGILDTDFNAGGNGVNAGYNGQVEDIDREGSTGNIYIGGFFTWYNGIVRQNVARLNPDGSLDTSFGSPGTFVNHVYNIEIQNDGKILVSGDFSLDLGGGNYRASLIRLNTDGSIDPSFNHTFATGSVHYINSMLLLQNGKILIGGYFGTSTRTDTMARLNSDGSYDNTFNNGNIFDSGPSVLKVLPDGSILAGGYFYSLNGSDKFGIAKFDSNGNYDSSFNVAGLSKWDYVFDIELAPDGKIYIGGEFYPFLGTTANCIMRLNSDGSRDTSFNQAGNGTGSGSPHKILRQSDGKVILIGSFSEFAGATRYSVARMNEDGSNDSTFVSGDGFKNTWRPHTGLLQPDGKLIVGGEFDRYNGILNVNKLLRLK